MNLIGLLVLLALVSLVEGAVLKFSESCPHYFVQDQNGKPVTTVLEGVQYSQICQKYKNNNPKDYRYATLYDTHNKIPVYSAYLFTGSTPLPREGIPWKIEPQIDNPSSTLEEMDFSSLVALNLRGQNQALPKDYENSGYERGHLYPHCHNCDQYQANSTFTLTNAAPQNEEDNKDWYGQVEKVTANIIHNWCQNPAYVVTGVVPGDKWIGYGGTNKVNVPSYFWSAFCCQHRVTSNYLSVGFLAATKTGMEKELGKHPHNAWKMETGRMSVGDLNDKLKDLYNLEEFKVFGNVCK